MPAASRDRQERSRGDRDQRRDQYDGILFDKLASPNAAVDLGWIGWIPDYPDPDAMLGALLENGSVAPTFDDPATRKQLAAAARLGARAVSDV